MPTSRFRFDFVGSRIYERVTALQMYIYLYTWFFPSTCFRVSPWQISKIISVTGMSTFHYTFAVIVSTDTTFRVYIFNSKRYKLHSLFKKDKKFSYMYCNKCLITFCEGSQIWFCTTTALPHFCNERLQTDRYRDWWRCLAGAYKPGFWPRCWFSYQ